ncbi:MAG: hypothetical protein ABI925_10550 [Verrucomicrobiota bacterium]
MTADGTVVPEHALDQYRMLPPTAGSQGAPTMTPDGMQLPTDEEADGSFGKQVVLNTQERPHEFVVTGDSSVFFTSNPALTEQGADGAVFFVGSAAVAWNHRISQDLQLQVGGRAALFRYDARSDLDFDSFGGGVGLTWSPAFSSGIVFFGGYDATKLLKRGGDDLLTEHAFTVGAAKVIVLSRSQALTFNLAGGLGITDPHSAQRDLIAAGVAYHLRLSRDLDLDAGYRGTVYFYDTRGRTDFNGLASLSLSYHFARWATVSAYGSFADNFSNRSGFDYRAWIGGTGITLSWQF